MNDVFELLLDADVDIVKAEGAKKARRIIKGVASTPHRDEQDESMLQAGLDVSYFQKHGWFNYDHHRDEILGYPFADSVRVDKSGLFVEGVLLEGEPRADYIFTLSKALQRAGGERKLGMSVEGRVLKKRPDGTIEKAKIYNVAITPHPVNTQARFDVLVKSFTDPDAAKALTAGYATSPDTQSGGGAMRVESLGFDPLKDLSFGDCAEFDGWRRLLCEELARRRGVAKSVPFDDAVTFVQLSAGVSRAVAEQVIQETLDSDA